MAPRRPHKLALTHCGMPWTPGSHGKPMACRSHRAKGAMITTFKRLPSPLHMIHACQVRLPCAIAKATLEQSATPTKGRVCISPSHPKRTGSGKITDHRGDTSREAGDGRGAKGAEGG